MKTQFGKLKTIQNSEKPSPPWFTILSNSSHPSTERENWEKKPEKYKPKLWNNKINKMTKRNNKENKEKSTWEIKEFMEKVSDWFINSKIK